MLSNARNLFGNISITNDFTEHDFNQEMECRSQKEEPTIDERISMEGKNGITTDTDEEWMKNEWMDEWNDGQGS